DDVAVGHAGELAQDTPVEVGLEREVDVEVETLPLAREVLVELAACRVDRNRGAQHTQAEDAGEQVQLTFGVGVVRDAAEAAVGGSSSARCSSCAKAGRPSSASSSGSSASARGRRCSSIAILLAIVYAHARRCSPCRSLG